MHNKGAVSPRVLFLFINLMLAILRDTLRYNYIKLTSYSQFLIAIMNIPLFDIAGTVIAFKTVSNFIL